MYIGGKKFGCLKVLECVFLFFLMIFGAAFDKQSRMK